MKLEQYPCLLHTRPWNMIFQPLFGHMQTDSNDILPTHLLKFTTRLAETHAVDQRIYLNRQQNIHFNLHEINHVTKKNNRK